MHVIAVYESVKKLETTFFKTENSQQALRSNQSQDPSFSGLYVPRVGIRKTKHMLIVSQGVHSMSCLLKVSLVAANSQLSFSRLSVRLHLAFEDMWIPMYCKKATYFWGNMATIWAAICQPYSFSTSRRGGVFHELFIFLQFCTGIFVKCFLQNLRKSEKLWKEFCSIIQMINYIK